MTGENRAEHVITVAHGKRMAALFRITDPLWKAIAAGHRQEVARLQAELAALLKKDKLHD